jgi:hypothetical protein
MAYNNKQDKAPTNWVYSKNGIGVSENGGLRVAFGVTKQGQPKYCYLTTEALEHILRNSTDLMSFVSRSLPQVSEALKTSEEMTSRISELRAALKVVPDAAKSAIESEINELNQKIKSIFEDIA